MTGLVENGMFKTIIKEEVPQGTRIFWSRLVDEQKQAEQGTRKESRLVAQNCSGEDATYIATKTPTVQRSSQRLIMSLVAYIDGMKNFTRDGTQDYIQSSKKLERYVFITEPKEFCISPRHGTQCTEIIVRNTVERPALVLNIPLVPHGID